MDKRISDLRLNYSKRQLDKQDLDTDPIKQFRQWFDEALEANIPEPNAMTLSTSVDQKVFSRIVLLKQITDLGFVFFTNYDSAKGKEMAINDNVALCFLWKEIERQVRIEGHVQKISEEDSLAYAKSRPRSSQIGAWVSDQSQVIASREVIEKKLKETEERFDDTDDIPKPPHWGGYLVVPEVVEFWQGRPGRLHDRLRFRRENENWMIERLSP